MKELIKTDVPKDSVVTVKKEEFNGKIEIIVEIESKNKYNQGDILTVIKDNQKLIGILNGNLKFDDFGFPVSAGIDLSGKLCYNDLFGAKYSSARYATQDERQYLFEELRKDGKKWNPYTLELENLPEELKEGDLVIGTYGLNSEYHFIGRYEGYKPNTMPWPHRIEGILCANAVKFESLDQYERIRKGEI
ncbi:MAG: hypothetical protein GX102_04700 [Porphyromonadaceae bacterium]|jgi:hypothetical protein|nr:hypothetical protein [Porphyromonadaceae bacterium]